MIRTRISEHETIDARAREQEYEPQFKPSGLWYEVDGDWRRWCASEARDWVAGKFVHRVDLGETRMLTIRNVAEFDRFHREYTTVEGYYGVKWRDVAQRFDGIEIAPYLWSRRFDPLWYYGWDCASGVVWNPRGVVLTLVGKIVDRPRRALPDGGDDDSMSDTGTFDIVSVDGRVVPVT